jgi:hypothetical protein
VSQLLDPHVDKLGLYFFALESPIDAGDEGLDDALRIVESYAGELMPDMAWIRSKTKAPYSRAVARQTLSNQEPPLRMVALFRSSAPEAEWGLSFGDQPLSRFRVSISAAPFSAEQRGQQLLSLMRAFASRYAPHWGFCHNISDAVLGTSWADVKNALPDLTGIYWLNILGKPLVEHFGRERVLSTPASHLEELPNGSVLFLIRPTPADFDSEEARIAQAKALVHLRPELDFDSILAKLRERSRAFVPVKRDWDPDLAPVLEKALSYFDFSELQTRTAAFNQLRPSPPAEWLSLSSAPSTDVDDPQQAISVYEGLHAERLAALMHSEELLSIMEGTPESLPDLDAHLWRFKFYDHPPSKMERFLIPMVGAYLGMVMVRHLGGRWVPRRKLDESQVIVGNRAWLPFLRARHHLQSQAAAFDYSLTQLYRFAARYRDDLVN